MGEECASDIICKFSVVAGRDVDLDPVDDRSGYPHGLGGFDGRLLRQKVVNLTLQSSDALCDRDVNSMWGNGGLNDDRCVKCV